MNLLIIIALGYFVLKKLQKGGINVSSKPIENLCDKVGIPTQTKESYIIYLESKLIDKDFEIEDMKNQIDSYKERIYDLKNAR